MQTLTRRKFKKVLILDKIDFRIRNLIWGIKKGIINDKVANIYSTYMQTMGIGE